MKIIKKGNPPEEQPWRGECKACGAVLEAARSELKTDYDQRDGSEWGRAPCPCCKAGVVFYPKGK
jgi:hypothetical protein